MADQDKGQLNTKTKTEDDLEARVIATVLEDIKKRGPIFRTFLQQMKLEMSRFGQQL
ncbi:MAG: hypothetical protein ACYC6G_13960 [Desulfobaccales bacterium]